MQIKKALSRRERVGFAMLIAAAVGFGISPSCAKLAYSAGAEPLTLVFARFTVCLLGITAISHLQNVPLFTETRLVLKALLMGCLLAWNASGYLSAVKYVPVSLAAALFYTFPVQVGVISAVCGLDSLTRRRVLALFVAFAGVLLSVGFGTYEADWRGVVLAIGAGTGVAMSSVLFARMAQEGNSITLVFWAMIAASAVSWLVMSLSVGVQLPNDRLGWIGFLISMFAFAFALVAYYLALPLVGAVRAALTANLEPVIAIIVAVIVLREEPRFLQLVGITLILGAVFLARYGVESLPGRSGSQGS